MSKYQQLTKLIEQGLRPGTVLAEFSCGNEWLYAWDGLTVLRDDGTSYDGNPLDPYRQWRIVSTPPKKITFETTIQHGGGHNPQYVYLPEPVDFVSAIVTVEEKR